MELSKGPRRIFKQQQQTKLYSHTLNLNTIALQISQKMLFGAGKSNRIENNENESTYQYRTRWKHAFSTHIIKKRSSFAKIHTCSTHTWEKQDVLLTFAFHYILHHNMTTTRHTSFSLEQHLIFLSYHPLLSGGVTGKNGVTHIHYNCIADNINYSLTVLFYILLILIQPTIL